MDDRHGPHLTLHEAQAGEDGVGGIGDGEGVRAARVVALAADEVVPGLAVAVEGAVGVAEEGDVVAAEEPGGGLVLVAHGEGVGEPVLDVSVPLGGGR